MSQADAEETCVVLDGRTWRIACVHDQDALVRAVRTAADLERFPYGRILWPSALALASRLCADPTLVAGQRVLELGAGVGLPGLIAQHLSARVTQTDYEESALALARVNAARNNVSGIHHVRADWRAWPFPACETFPVVLGSDILYERTLHADLMGILESALAPGGFVLLSDPLRPQAVDFVDGLEARGWSIALRICVKTIIRQSVFGGCYG